MNRFLIFLVLFLLVCCKKQSEDFSKPAPVPATSQEPSIDIGKKIFNGRGQCITCHRSNQNTAGPSIKKIISFYKDNKSDMIKFLKGNSEPIVDPSQFLVMKVNLEITKKMTDQELQSLVDYIYTIKLD